MTKHFVIIIAGPTGVGKTTLSKMLSKHYDYHYLSEDETAKELYTDTYKNIEDYPDKMKLVADQLLKRAKEMFNEGKCVVIDRINLEKEFIKEMQKRFHEHLMIKVLWPPIETTIERDKKREGWTSGENAIRTFYKNYKELRPIIGVENYLDNCHQTPDETLEELVAAIELYK